MLKRWNLHNASRRSVYGVSTILIILLAIVIVVISWLGQSLEAKQKNIALDADLKARFAESPPTKYKGALYRPYENLTTILVIGVDRYSDQDDLGLTYRNGGQADYLQLLVLNDDTRTITPIQIDRDTMTRITILGVLGDETGSRVVQICLSHGFGDGKEQSCELTVRAVSELLNDTDIDFYISMDMDGIPTLNDALGGVTVTLEDDFSILDPEMVKGTTLTLQGMQAEYFVRGRMYIGVGTNAARMNRQRIFMDSLAERISQRIHEEGSAAFLHNLLDTLAPYFQTDMRRGRMINEAWNTRDYNQLEPVRMAGEYRTGPHGFNEFYADKDALSDMLMDIFYYPIATEPMT